MQIPETSNPHFQHAFKKGYRMALEGRSVDSMPSDFRRDMELRRYFQDGWEQAVEDSKLAQSQMNKPDWKHRFVWFLIMLVGGIATAMHIISLYEGEQAAQQNLIDNTAINSTPLHSSNKLNEPLSNTSSLSLLNEQSREDLKLNQQEAINNAQTLPLAPVIKSPIKISKAVISADIKNGQPSKVFENSVPKYVRNLYFFTMIENSEHKTIYHRWRTEKQILATIELQIKAGQNSIWSNKKLSSAWQGKWYLEVLDNNKDVIYRQTFSYSNQ